MSTRLKAVVLAVIMATAMVGAGAANVAGSTGTTGEGEQAMNAAADDEANIPSSFEGTVGDGHFEVGSGDDSERFEIQGIEVAGEVDEDGSFHAPSENVNFPEFEVEDTAAGDIDVYIEAPNGLDGQIQENGEMTLEGDLYIDLREITEGCGIDVNIGTTTGDSGELSGSPIDLGDDDATGQATLVDNEFEVPESEGCGAFSGAVDGELGLPAEPGENELEMHTDFEFGYGDGDVDTDTGTVEGTVTNADGEPVTGADVAVDGEEVATDSDGAFETEATEGEQEISVQAAGYEDAQATADVAAGDTVSEELSLEPDGETDYRTAAEPIEGEAGDTGTTDVVIEPVSDDADEVDEFELAVEYDADVVDLTDASEADWEEIDVDDGDGTLTVSADNGLFSLSGEEAPLTAFTADYELVGDEGDEASIGFSDDSEVDGDGGDLLGLVGGPATSYEESTASIDGADAGDDDAGAPDEGDDDAGAPDEGDDDADAPDGDDDDDAGVPDEDDGDDEGADGDDELAEGDEFDGDAAAEWMRAEADRLQDDIFTQAVREINAQAEEEVGYEVAEPVDTPEEAREQGDELGQMSDVSDRADEAAQAMYDAADRVEMIQESFDDAADRLEDADDDELEDVMEEINEETIAETNDALAEANEDLENVEDIETVEELDPEGDLDEHDGADGDGANGDAGGDDEGADALGSSVASLGAGVALISALAGVVISLWSTMGAGLLTRND